MAQLKKENLDVVNDYRRELMKSKVQQENIREVENRVSMLKSLADKKRKLVSEVQVKVKHLESLLEEKF